MKSKNYFLKFKDWSKYGLLLIALFFSGSALADDLSDGLVVHYTFDDPTSTGLVTDHSGNVNDGICMGGAVVLPDQGFDGKGALYLGTVAKPAVDYLQLTDDITVGMTDFSVAAWVKIDNSMSWQRIFDFGNGTNNNMFLAVRGGGTNMRFAIKKGNEQWLEGAPIPVNTWVHVAVTGDYTTNTCKLYLNGIEVGSKTDLTYTPDGMGTTDKNYIGSGQYGDQGFNGYVDDFRVYNRALSVKEMMMLNGYTEEEIMGAEELDGAYEALQGMDSDILGMNNESFDYVWDDLKLMNKIDGYDNVDLTWESSDESVITTEGKVLPTTGSAVVELKVTLTHSKIPAKKEKTYTVIVSGDPLPAQIAAFTFDNSEYADGKVKFVSKVDLDPEIPNPEKYRYAGTLENGAKIRTIGTTDTKEYKVLDLGSKEGYFDMGKEIGETVCKLTDFTMSCYYLVEEDAEGAFVEGQAGGNPLWCFSNSNDLLKDRNGAMHAKPWDTFFSITANLYSNAQKIEKRSHFTQEEYLGKWHNLLYTQAGTTGTIYVDGVSAISSSSISLLPIYLKLAGRKGTDYNYLGRPPYITDHYTDKTLLHDFRIYAYPLPVEEIDALQIPATLAELNLAYQTNDGRDQVNTELNAVYNNLTLDIPSRITEDMIFPESLDEYPDIAIVWTTSNEAVLDGEGKVMRQKYYDYPIDSISARLIDTRTGETLSKVFKTTSIVPMVDGTAVTTNDLLVHYDFSQVSGRTVTDKGAMQLQGTLMNEAEVVEYPLKDGGTMNVLALGDSIGYFDMGQEIGQIMYHTHDYTLGAYVFIDTTYVNAAKNGNFLWTFANGEGKDGGYNIAILSSMRVEMNGSTTPTEGITMYLDSVGNATGKAPEQGKWFHFAYSQNGEVGTVYLDGVNMNSMIINNTPAVGLPMPNKVGTVFNWIGRSNFSADTYLRKSYVADFRFYGVALDDSELESRLDLAATLDKLNNTATSVQPQKVDSPYKVFVRDGQVEISGLKNSKNISLFDTVGRRYSVNKNNTVKLNPGIYIIKIDNFTTKILVK